MTSEHHRKSRRQRYDVGAVINKALRAAGLMKR